MEFPEGWGGGLKIPSVGEVWIFSGITQFMSSLLIGTVIHTPVTTVLGLTGYQTLQVRFDFSVLLFVITSLHFFTYFLNSSYAANCTAVYGMILTMLVPFPFKNKLISTGFSIFNQPTKLSKLVRPKFNVISIKSIGK